MPSTKKIISGATLGSLLGSLAAMVYPRRNEILDYMREHSNDFDHLKDLAKEYGHNLLTNGQHRRDVRNNYLKAGLVGLLLGAGTALLLAPKTGKTLRGQLSRAYNDISERSEELIHQFKNNSSHPFSEAHTHHNGIKKKKPALKRSRK